MYYHIIMDLYEMTEDESNINMENGSKMRRFGQERTDIFVLLV